MKQLIIVILCITSLNITSQNRTIGKTNGVFNNNLEFFAMLKVGNKNNNEFTAKANGKYYLLAKWAPCNIETNDNKEYTINKCNYNVFDNRFELLLDKEVLFLNKEIIKKIEFNNKIFKTIKVDHRFKNNYYEDLGANKKVNIIRLYTLRKKVLPSKESLGLFENKVEVLNKKYFIYNEEIIEIPKSTKKTFKLLDLKYDKKNHKKLKTKTIKDLHQIISLKLE
jgi:hypothetical protein